MFRLQYTVPVVDVYCLLRQILGRVRLLHLVHPPKVCDVSCLDAHHCHSRYHKHLRYSTHDHFSGRAILEAGVCYESSQGRIDDSGSDEWKNTENGTKQLQMMIQLSVCFGDSVDLRWCHRPRPERSWDVVAAAGTRASSKCR